MSTRKVFAQTLLERGGEQSKAWSLPLPQQWLRLTECVTISLPERSETIVWKFRSASKQPCEISAWYGYTLYQPGFSMFLLITDGTRSIVAHADVVPVDSVL